MSQSGGTLRRPAALLPEIALDGMGGVGSMASSVGSLNLSSNVYVADGYGMQDVSSVRSITYLSSVLGPAPLLPVLLAACFQTKCRRYNILPWSWADTGWCSGHGSRELQLPACRSPEEPTDSGKPSRTACSTASANMMPVRAPPTSIPNGPDGNRFARTDLPEQKLE
jgi:hypothetical protein